MPAKGYTRGSLRTRHAGQLGPSTSLAAPAGIRPGTAQSDRERGTSARRQFALPLPGVGAEPSPRAASRPPRQAALAVGAERGVPSHPPARLRGTPVCRTPPLRARDLTEQSLAVYRQVLR